MTKREDFLVEIHTEELPAKAIIKLGEAFKNQLSDALHKANLLFAEATYFATPRRLAVLVRQLAQTQPQQSVDRKGPTLAAAFDKDGKPSPACVGFARSCGVTPEELMTLKTSQGEWVSYRQEVPGKSVQELLPLMVEQVVAALPIPKRMRWGANDAQFTRPIHSVIMLYGDQVIPATILGFKAGNVTRGHRFHAPDWLSIPHASEYESLLENKGHVLADITKRRERMMTATADLVSSALKVKAQIKKDADLIDEVTGLVEWPVPLVGNFDERFLQLPQEVLISSMQDHQRYFPILGPDKKILPHFVTVSNLESKNPQQVIHGNERVLRARLSDAAFFYAADQKESLALRLERLKGIVFQAKLGTLFAKAERLSQLAAFIAKKIHANSEQAERAGWLAKTDLTTSMVGEFPELQGVMGCYYAQYDGETENVAVAMQEQYMPRFAGDTLPNNAIGQALALADRIDTLVGAFGINQIPTGDKDPYGLRRAAVGIIRILIEKQINLDLKECVTFAIGLYRVKLENPETEAQILNFIQERLRSYYQEQSVSADIFASVATLGITNPLDLHERIKAVQAFKKLTEAETLSIANKRVSNILAKYAATIDAKAIDPSFFENAAESALAQQLEAKSAAITRLYQAGQYEQVLMQLAELRKPIDDFFDQVMVMTEDKQVRENRILLLNKLRSLFLQVADIALLQ